MTTVGPATQVAHTAAMRKPKAPEVASNAKNEPSD